MSTVKLNIDGIDYTCTPAGTAPPVVPPVVPPVIPPVVPPGTCPPYGGSIGTFQPPGGNTHIRLQSGNVASYLLPTATTRSSLYMEIDETTGTAPKSFLEVCISKCPGVIDTTAGTNYFGTYTQAGNGMTWFFKLAPPFTKVTDITNRGYAWAPANEGPWYFNVRVTYPVAPAWGYDERIYNWSAGPY